MLHLRKLGSGLSKKGNWQVSSLVIGLQVVTFIASLFCVCKWRTEYQKSLIPRFHPISSTWPEAIACYNRDLTVVFLQEPSTEEPLH
jgi:hypothetical protein